MSPPQFSTLYLNALTSSESVVTVKNGCTLRVEETPGVYSNVVTSSVLSAQSSSNNSYTDAALVESKAYTDSSITALKDGAETALDTLSELAQQIRSDEQGVSSLTLTVAGINSDLHTEVNNRVAAVAAEESARIAAIADEQSARVAAINTEISDRVTAVSNERSDRIAAVNLEISARTNADNAERDARVLADNNLYKTIFNVCHVPLSPAVYADAKAPSPIPSSQLAALGQDGWYFKNVAAGNKINWYSLAPMNSNGVSKVADLAELAMSLKLVNKASTPYFTVYTKPFGNYVANGYLTNPSIDAASWYHSKATFVIDGDVAGNDYGTLENGMNYLFQARVGSGYTADATNESCEVNKNGFRSIVLKKSPVVSATKGEFIPSLDVLFIAVSTDSGSAAGNVEFILHDLTMMSSNGNMVLKYSNADVMNKYLQDKLEAVYQQLGQQSILL